MSGYTPCLGYTQVASLLLLQGPGHNLECPLTSQVRFMGVTHGMHPAKPHDTTQTSTAQACSGLQRTAAEVELASL